MSVGIFVAGAMVTLVVAFALIIVIWGAVMDGREQSTGETEAGPASTTAVRASEMRATAPSYEAVPGRARIGLEQGQHAKVW